MDMTTGNDNYKQIYSWAKILRKITANITPDIAKECADFCSVAIQFNIDRMQNDREKMLIPEFAEILKYIKPVMSGDFQNISIQLKDNYKHLFTWTEILEEISENLDFDIAENCNKFCVTLIDVNIPYITKMLTDRERDLALKFQKVIGKIESYGKIEKAQPPIPKIIHYCWLSNDPIPEKLQQCMESWRNILPDYEFMLWDFNRFNINTSLWVKQAFHHKKYAFAADFIRFYAIFNHGGIYLDMDVEVVKSFNDLLFTDCMIAREDYNERMRLEGGCFGAIKGHPFVGQCLEFYRSRSFNPESMNMCQIPDMMGAVLGAGFKDAITVLTPDYFTAKSFLTGIVTKTENTRTIHHFTGSWLPPEMQLKIQKRWEHYQFLASMKEIDTAISLLSPSCELNKEYILHEITGRINLSETHNTKNSPVNASVFSEIYRNNYWGSGESRSGRGSELSATERLRQFLPYIWNKYQIKSLFDAPCGDYNWMRMVEKNGIIYIGGDIVPDCIENNNKQYKEENVSFKVMDITKDDLPKVDMIFCKDCLQHLSNEDIWKALKNFRKSGSTWLLTTSYPLTQKNWDIQNGGYRPLNLLAEPFNFNNFYEKIHENLCAGSEPDKMMFMYRLDDLNLEPADLFSASGYSRSS